MSPKPQLLFEILSRDNKRVFYTENEKCIPSKEDLKYMQKNSGYKFKLDKKVYKI